MKIFLFTDVHWSTNTSIVRSRGANFSTRLELLINSMNWVNKLAVEKKCNFMICAGDMMDKSFCTDEEITALNRIEWADLKCFFLVGNHESSVKNLQYSSTNQLLGDTRHIIDIPASIIMGDTLIDFIPYIKDIEEVQMSDLVSPESSLFKKHIVISHNAIKGIQYGAYLSKVGLSIADIESSCDLFLNGHLHNQMWVTDKILNLGSLTAHNFTNDSFKYQYGAWILDTDTLELEFFENPYSLNFYKIDIKTEQDIDIFNQIKNNSVIAVKCKSSMKSQIDEKINSIKDKIVKCNFSIETEMGQENETSGEKIATIEHLNSFGDYVLENVGDSDIIKEELQQILGEM